MTQLRLVNDPFFDLFNPPDMWDKDPLRCSICHESFEKEQWARRCESQGLPFLHYRTGDLIRRGHDNDSLLLVRMVRVHHAVGVKCHVEGPCPHDATYYCYRMYADWFGPDRAWLSSVGRAENYHEPRPGHEVVGRLTMPWGVIAESGAPEIYFAGPDQHDIWTRLWCLWDEMKLRTGRRAGRRLLR